MTDADERAWRQGHDAGRAGLPESANPYETGTPLAEDWHDGWREGTHPRELPMDPDAWVSFGALRWRAGQGVELGVEVGSSLPAA